MRRRTRVAVGAGVTATAVMVALMAPSTSATAAPKADKKAWGGFKHLVVIYEENHSFDNLYGGWGKVGDRHVVGRKRGPETHRTQISQTGVPYQCLMQNDVNLTVGPLSHRCGPETVTFPDNSTTSYDSHFTNRPFKIDNYIKPEDTTCPKLDALFSSPNGVKKGEGLPGGCTRDLVHKFYQEIYQLNGGKMNRYVTGSDAVGLTMGYYATRQLPIYKYLHRRHAPNYVIADHFFQAAYGGSYLNHQYLVAAQPPLLPDPLPAGTTHAVLDSGGGVHAYPLYKPTGTVVDGTVTQECGTASAANGLACGNWSINTSLPATQPTAGYGPKIPLIDDTQKALNIGDRLSDAGVSWAWFSGGWDNAAGITNGRGWTNGTGPTCSDPDSTPAGPDASGQNAGFPFCPHRSFQQHHQPLAYYANYAPGTTGRAKHLKDEADFFFRARHGKLPRVSFVKPLGIENEHPGYASEPNGSDHLVDLLKAIRRGPDGRNTLVLVTYDEFGGQWDHMSPPGLGRKGPHDQFGPGSRIPAILISPRLRSSSVDHRVYDTTSILATIEARFGLKPVAHPAGVVPRDRKVDPLTHAIRLGLRR